MWKKQILCTFVIVSSKDKRTCSYMFLLHIFTCRTPFPRRTIIGIGRAFTSRSRKVGQTDPEITVEENSGAFRETKEPECKNLKSFIYTVIGASVNQSVLKVLTRLGISTPKMREEEIFNDDIGFVPNEPFFGGSVWSSLHRVSVTEVAVYFYRN